ncbi:hypothetical protein KEU06_15590 [Pseudaminobacter sp. 19-2017]|uniref:Biotin transporter BioY n=1 Tax=Pseudaminobacter soli (ex Zhang et al. 2022) TaxID=2831468 RepID=A0A942E2U9_9HYPH|nr:hypothetical protein [Pseudaminobacter soli]MBS3650035.1 hypothetical protein [Pseudaminobacter soli]
MDPIEKAIRSAFEKGNAEDRAFRESVYRKAFEALDRALQANQNLTVEAAINRRKVLQARIAEIETEFIPAVPAADPLAGSFEIRMEPGEAPPIVMPELTADRVDRDAGALGGIGELDVREEFSDRASRSRAAPPLSASDPKRSRRRSRKPLVLMFVALCLVALVGIGILFAQQAGLFPPRQEGETSMPNPQATIEAEDFNPESDGQPPALTSQPAEQRDWISIFTAADATAVSAPAGIKAESMDDDSGSFLRIRSSGSGAAVLFDVGQGVLQRIAGRKATFDIVARGSDGEQVEMAVDCNFGELGDCGRKRYAVGYEKADFLFELGLPEVDPGAGGTIAIDPDFAGEGKSLDIYEIKVSVSP